MISSHVLDTALGSPARSLMVHLDLLEALGDGSERDEHETWRRLASATTNEDGRVTDLADAADLAGRTCRLAFETAAYFIATSRPTFFPRVEVLFVPVRGVARYHIPLLLSPFGYSVYRGS